MLTYKEGGIKTRVNAANSRSVHTPAAFVPSLSGPQGLSELAHKFIHPEYIIKLQNFFPF